MPFPKDHAAAAMASPEDAEAQFYEALREGDLEGLMAVWADDEDVVCVHPGGARVIGADGIRATFAAIFANGPIAVRVERVQRIQAMGSAVHSVLECVAVETPEGTRSGWIVATNVYLKTTQGWRMVIHHASPGAVDETQAADAPPAVLH